MSSGPVVYVAGDGSGDFNCDGKEDDVQINQALKLVAENSKYTTVHLKGPFTYTISNSISIQSSNTILEGGIPTLLSNWSIMQDGPMSHGPLNRQQGFAKQYNRKRV